MSGVRGGTVGRCTTGARGAKRERGRRDEKMEIREEGEVVKKETRRARRRRDPYFLLWSGGCARGKARTGKHGGGKGRWGEVGADADRCPGDEPEGHAAWQTGL